MGMNYYFLGDKDCDHEDYKDEEFCWSCFNTNKELVHIGKSSMGWQFSWQSNPEYNLCSSIEYRNFLKDKVIYNEDRDIVTYEFLFDLIDSKFTEENKNHTIYCRNSKNSWEVSHGIRDCYLDALGHSFSVSDFS